MNAERRTTSSVELKQKNVFLFQRLEGVGASGQKICHANFFVTNSVSTF